MTIADIEQAAFIAACERLEMLISGDDLAIDKESDSGGHTIAEISGLHQEQNSDQDERRI